MKRVRLRFQHDFMTHDVISRKGKVEISAWLYEAYVERVCS